MLHLLRLPLLFFLRRSTGTTLARLQAVETIREFLSGAAMGLVLDLPFLVIALAVMFAYSCQLSLIAVGSVMLLAVLSALFTVPAVRAISCTATPRRARSEASMP